MCVNEAPGEGQGTGVVYDNGWEWAGVGFAMDNPKTLLKLLPNVFVIDFCAKNNTEIWRKKKLANTNPLFLGSWPTVLQNFMELLLTHFSDSPLADTGENITSLGEVKTEEDTY